MKFTLFTFALLWWAAQAQAFAPAAGPKDSIGMERKGGKVLVLYKVEPGETLFAIARKYRTTVDKIKALNPALSTGGIQKGQTLRVPALAGDKAAQTASLPVPKNGELEKVHVVTAGQTLFAIARQYGAKVDDIKAWNNLTTNSLFEGQQLVVAKPGAKAPAADAKGEHVEDAISMSRPAEKAAPVEKTPAAKPEPKTEAPKAAETAKTETAAQAVPAPKTGTTLKHTVKAGETLFAIARMYNAQPADIQKMNNLPSGAVQVGQVLEVKQGPEMVEKPATGLAEKVDETKNLHTDTAVSSTSTNNTLGYERVVERGIAEVSDKDDSRQYLCLHRTAPTGKVLQVKNEMNGVSVYVRVIGKLPDTGQNDKVIVKISRRAFAQLKAADNRFPVEVSYTGN